MTNNYYFAIIKSQNKQQQFTNERNNNMREFAIYEERSYMPDFYNERLTIQAMDNCYNEAEVEDYVEWLNEEFPVDEWGDERKLYVEWY